MSDFIEKIKEEIPPCPLNESEISSDRECNDLSYLNSARKDKFLLVINLPNCFLNLRKKHNDSKDCDKDCFTFLNDTKLQMNVFGNVVPNISVPKIEKQYGGRVLNFSSLSRPSYDPINVNFTIDAQYENYFVIYKWLDIINDDLNGVFDGKNSIEGSGHGAYTSTFNLFAIDEYNKKVARWDFFGAFPTTLGSIEYSKRDPEEIECNFTYEFNFMKMYLTNNTAII